MNLKSTRYSEEEKINMARAYLKYGTVREAAKSVKCCKSTIHKTVSDFIENGGFEDVEALKMLIEKNKNERAVRGGTATAHKFEQLNKP